MTFDVDQPKLANFILLSKNPQNWLKTSQIIANTILHWIYVILDIPLSFWGAVTPNIRWCATLISTMKRAQQSSNKWIGFQNSSDSCQILLVEMMNLFVSSDNVFSSLEYFFVDRGIWHLKVIHSLLFSCINHWILVASSSAIIDRMLRCYQQNLLSAMNYYVFNIQNRWSEINQDELFGEKTTPKNIIHR